MLNQIKIGLAGLIASVSTFVILMLANRYYPDSIMLKYFQIESIIVTTETFIACVCKGKFYDKERDTKGLSLLLTISAIALIIAIALRNTILILASLSFIADCYVCYVDDLAIYKSKDILTPSIVYTLFKTLLAILIIKFKVFMLIDEVTSIVFINTFSDVILLMVFKRIYWNIKFSNVFNISVFDTGWYKSEIKGIINTLMKNNNSITSRVIKIFVTVSISKISGYESVANFILTVQKAGVPFFAARDLNYKKKLNRIADTNELDMKTDSDKSIFRAVMLWYAGVLATVLYYAYSIKVQLVFIVLMGLVQTIHYFVFTGNLYFQETVLKNRNYGVKITLFYILAHTSRFVIMNITGSIYAYIIVMFIEPVVHYIYIYYMYRNNRIKNNEEVKIYSLKEIIGYN